MTKTTILSTDVDNMTANSYQPTEQEILLKKIEKAQELLKKLKSEKKSTEKKTLKGQPMKFKNKAGQEIVGYGVTYYVVNLNGKLHYKEASSVTMITEEELKELSK